MHRPDVRDKKLFLLIAFLFLLVIVMGLIWRHYDIELRKIEKQRNELNWKIKIIYPPSV